MVANRGLIVLGAVLIALILICGSCSVGVYVGRYGLSAQGLRLAPNIPNQPVMGADNVRPPRFPTGDPDVIGLLRTGSQDGLVLATREGLREIQFNQQTIILETGGRILRLHDLRPGDILAVYGEWNANKTDQLVATTIIRIQSIPPNQP